jgi:hypothetical protein
MARRWHDDADWTDVDFTSVRNRTGKFPFNGYPHVTIGEQRLAKLLTRMGIAYTPDVRLVVRAENGRDGMIFVPDFVFNRQVYVWHEPNGRQMLIHGIEVKKASRGFFPGRAIRKVKLVREERRINILLLNHKQIDFFLLCGRLPMHLARQRKPKRKKHKRFHRPTHKRNSKSP